MYKSLDIVTVHWENKKIFVHTSTAGAIREPYFLHIFCFKSMKLQNINTPPLQQLLMNISSRTHILVGVEGGTGV